MACDPVPNLEEPVVETVADMASGFKEVGIEDQFLIRVPDYMAPTTQINPSASLVYGSHRKEVFVMVIEDSKAMLQTQSPGFSLDAYYQLVVSRFEALNPTQPRANNIHNLRAIQITARGSINETNLIYHIAVLEGHDRFYQIVSWAREEDAFEYEPMLKQMIGSFREKA